MEHLSEEFWSERYQSEETGWDLGDVSPPLKHYFDQLKNKEISILIPGCGHGYEAEYLHNSGFKNVHIIDIASEPLEAFKQRVPGFPTEHIHKGDFFEHSGNYDLIIEQTMFCAIDPELRQKYAETVHCLLKPGGKLVGLLFNHALDSGPPFGGSKEEYLNYFEPLFVEVKIEQCYNSVKPRMGREFFVRLKK